MNKLMLAIALSFTSTILSAVEIEQITQVKLHKNGCVKVDNYHNSGFTEVFYKGWVCPQHDSERSALSSWINNPAILDEGERLMKERWKQGYSSYVSSNKNRWQLKCAATLRELFEKNLTDNHFFEYSCDQIDNEYADKCVSIILDKQVSEALDYPWKIEMADFASCGTVENKLKLDYLRLIIELQQSYNNFEGSNKFRLTKKQVYSVQHINNQFNVACGIMALSKSDDLSNTFEKECSKINSIAALTNLQNALMSSGTNRFNIQEAIQMSTVQ